MALGSELDTGAAIGDRPVDTIAIAVLTHNKEVSAVRCTGSAEAIVLAAAVVHAGKHAPLDKVAIGIGQERFPEPVRQRGRQQHHKIAVCLGNRLPEEPATRAAGANKFIQGGGRWGKGDRCDATAHRDIRGGTKGNRTCTRQQLPGTAQAYPPFTLPINCKVDDAIPVIISGDGNITRAAELEWGVARTIPGSGGGAEDRNFCRTIAIEVKRHRNIARSPKLNRLTGASLDQNVPGTRGRAEDSDISSAIPVVVCRHRNITGNPPIHLTGRTIWLKDKPSSISKYSKLPESVAVVITRNRNVCRGSEGDAGLIRKIKGDRPLRGFGVKNSNVNRVIIIP